MRAVSGKSWRGAPAQPWWPALAALVGGSLALGVALLVPRAFSDPVGVDPFSVRLAVVVGMVMAAAWAVGSLRPALPVMVALGAVVVPFVAWSTTPWLCRRLAGDRLSFVAELFVAGLVQVAVTVPFLLLARRIGGRQDRRPCLRLRSFGFAAAAWTLAGTGIFVVVFLLLPARPLGRIALEPSALARDAVWVLPACALQAAAQEVQFRGLLMGTLETVAPRWGANLGQASLFGLAHIAVQYEGPVGPFIPITIGLGLVFGWVTQRTRSLWPAIIVHALADIAVTVAILPGLYGQ